MYLEVQGDWMRPNIEWLSDESFIFIHHESRFPNDRWIGACFSGSLNCPNPRAVYLVKCCLTWVYSLCLLDDSLINSGHICVHEIWMFQNGRAVMRCFSPRNSVWISTSVHVISPRFIGCGSIAWTASSAEHDRNSRLLSVECLVKLIGNSLVGKFIYDNDEDHNNNRSDSNKITSVHSEINISFL